MPHTTAPNFYCLGLGLASAGNNIFSVSLILWSGPANRSWLQMKHGVENCQDYCIPLQNSGSSLSIRKGSKIHGIPKVSNNLKKRTFCEQFYNCWIYFTRWLILWFEGWNFMIFRRFLRAIAKPYISVLGAADEWELVRICCC